jgi:hypothetical protein
MNIDNSNVVASVEKDVHSFMEQFPLYPGLA